jgi:hypothetical protein
MVCLRNISVDTLHKGDTDDDYDDDYDDDDDEDDDDDDDANNNNRVLENQIIKIQEIQIKIKFTKFLHRPKKKEISI